MGTSSTSSSSSTAFTGQSAFSSDLQQVITRAVQIASLPITQLQNQESTLTNQQSELQTLGTQFAALKSALDSLNSSSGSNSLAATVDNQSVASATANSSALPGTYSVTIASIGSQTNTLSSAGSNTITDPSSGNISNSSSYTLTVDGTTYNIAPSGTSLNSLVQAINSSGANVQATVVNIGGLAAPDYRLSVQSTHYAPDTIQLNDGTHNLLTSLGAPGSYVTYQINGQPATPINSTSRSLPVSTGLTVNAIAAGTANVTVAQDSTKTDSAVTAFVSAYNAVVDELTKNRGQGGGALAGQSIVSSLQSALQNLVNYTSSSSGTIHSIADLGLTFDQNGHLQLDSSVLDQALSSSATDVTNFLGSETTGGFLQAASNILTGVTDSSNGLISQETTSIGTSIQNITTKIGTDQDQVKQLQTNLTQQMAAADATISALEQQSTQITNLFLAMQQAAKSISG